jgi:hypothetical protein
VRAFSPLVVVNVVVVVVTIVVMVLSKSEPAVQSDCEGRGSENFAYSSHGISL